MPSTSDARLARTEACVLGTFQRFPAVFDDFLYSNTRIEYRPGRTPHLFEHSLFGKNVWHTCDGEQDVRAWYRYNKDDLAFHPHAHVRVQSDGVVRLELRPGYEHRPEAVVRRNPQFESGFCFLYGTFAARVRFSELVPDQEVTASFFTMSPDKRSELDFEWTASDIFPDPGDGTMYVTNHSEGEQFGPDPLPGPEEMQKSGEVASSLAGTWLTLAVTFDGKRVRYRMQADEPGSVRFWEREMRQRLPRDPMRALFFLGVLEHHRTIVIDTTHTLDVDWFYYSPATSLSLDDIQAEVRAFREARLSRVSTTGQRIDECAGAP